MMPVIMIDGPGGGRTLGGPTPAERQQGGPSQGRADQIPQRQNLLLLPSCHVCCRCGTTVTEIWQPVKDRDLRLLHTVLKPKKSTRLKILKT